VCTAAAAKAKKSQNFTTAPDIHTMDGWMDVVGYLTPRKALSVLSFTQPLAQEQQEQEQQEQQEQEEQEHE
jgi:hypothetical protein